MSPEDVKLYNRTFKAERVRAEKIHTTRRSEAIVARAKRDAQIRTQSRGSRVLGGIIKAGKTMNTVLDKMPDQGKVEAAWGIGDKKKKSR